MVSFRHPDATGVAERTRLFTLAESLGGVESLIEVPQAMTHQSVEGSDAAVDAVLYPGLASHPNHDVAARQMSGFGGMVCIDVKGGEAAACQAFDRLQLIRRAASLGGAESLCSLPVLTSHWGYSDDALAKAGVTRGMMRLSIGLEDPEDLIADLRQALD
jgi:cystathionine beta-lyase/cystathionine gamma-synthase